MAEETVADRIRQRFIEELQTADPAGPILAADLEELAAENALDREAALIDAFRSAAERSR